MPDPLFWHRLQFGFTASFHYLFPQFTMGLALLIVILKIIALRRGDARYAAAARFWGRIFGISFAVGVVTGIPLEFQFGTNWARFSTFAGGVIGQTLAMEGTFAFFLESTFLGLFLFGEKRLGPRVHLASAVLLCLGAWVSGYFIVATNAFMQHPVGHSIGADGTLQLASFWSLVLHRWALWQYTHTMCGAVTTAAFVMAAVGALWALMRIHSDYARINLRLGVIVGVIAALLQLFPTGDRQGRLVADHQPAALAAMEGLFRGGPYAELAIIGQPDVARGELENPIVVPGALSFLAYGSFGSVVKGYNDFPADQRPGNLETLYYAYHIMVGLGTFFIVIMVTSAVLLWRRRLERSRAMLWVLLLSLPFPFIANTAGWMTTEMGRQPWLIYGVHRVADGASPLVSGGNVAFTILGFAGLYLMIGVVYLYLVTRELARGPAAVTALEEPEQAPTQAAAGR